MVGTSVREDLEQILEYGRLPRLNELKVRAGVGRLPYRGVVGCRVARATSFFWGGATDEN